MSNRYIPYGYKFEAGQPIPHPDESQIVREIFDRYCTGDSLKVIAEDLTHRQVEYSPGKVSAFTLTVSFMLKLPHICKKTT